MNWKKGTKDNSYLGDQNASFNSKDTDKSPILQNCTYTETDFCEIPYLDTSEDKYHRKPGISPIPIEHKYAGHSPQRNLLGQSILATIKHDINDRQDTSRVVKKTIPSLKLIIPVEKRERREKSPKTINIGDTEQDIEYNTRTLRRMPRNNTEQGNIFLDLPILSNSFTQNEPLNNCDSPTIDVPKNNSGIFHNINTREIDYEQYTMNPRDTRDPNPMIINKMSPKFNVEDDNSTIDNKGNESLRDYRNKTIIGNKNQQTILGHDSDGMHEGRHGNNRALNEVEKYIKNKEERNTLTDGEIKKLAKEIIHGYDPRKGTEGRLISMNQTIMRKGKEEELKERYKAFQKMTKINKLSSILLSKRESESNFDKNVSNRKTYDRKTLEASPYGTNNQKTIKKEKTPQQKFLFISLAMLSSKGPNCEDRTILRKMRFEKGGVVDLAQEQNQKPKVKYQVKTLQRKKSPDRIKQKIIYNPKHREKAAKIVQGWWREIRSYHTKLLDKIILIQSIFRGRWLRKYIYNIILMSYLHQRFIDIIENIMIKHIRPQIWDELFNLKKQKQLVLIKLFSNDRRWTHLRIKPYFEKWRKVAQFILDRNLKSKNLINMRRYNEDKKKLIVKYFSIWVIRANLSQYRNEVKEKDNKAKQTLYSALNKLLNGTKSLMQKVGLSKVEKQIEPFLINTIKSRIIKKLLLKKPKYSLDLLRKYFNKWNSNVLRLHMRDLKGGVLTTTAKRLLSKVIQNNLRRYFNTWKSHIPKNKETRYTRGKEIIEAVIHRIHYKKPLRAIIEKETNSNRRNQLIRLIKMKSGYLKNNHRYYFLQWNKQMNKIKDKSKLNKMYNTLLLMLINKRENKMLSDKFNKWKKTPVINIDRLFGKYNKFINQTLAFSNKELRSSKESFIGKLKNYVSKRTYNDALHKLFDRYENQDLFFLRFDLYKWRDQCKNLEIYDLKVQLFKYLCSIKESKAKRIRAYKTFIIWKFNTQTVRLLKSANENYQANQGLDKLNTLFKRRPMNFMIRMHKLMNNDYRPKYLESIAIRLDKPRSNLCDCFLRWKRANDIEITDNKMRHLKLQVLKGIINKLDNRTKRDCLLKPFFIWRKNPQRSTWNYQDLSQGINKANKVVINKSLKVPFETIKTTKNYSKKMVPLLKSYKNFQKKYDKDALMYKFLKWKNETVKNKVMVLKSNILFKTKNNVYNYTKGKLLTKYFTRWKVIRLNKGVNAEIYEAFELLTNYCKRPYIIQVLNAFKETINASIKTKGLSTLYRASKSYSKQLNHKAFFKWYLNSKLTHHPNKSKNLKSKLKKQVTNREQKLLSRFFKKWIKVLMKKTNYSKVIQGSDTIKELFIQKYNTGFIDRLNKTISQNYINKKIITHIIPNSKIAKNRSLRSFFDKWRSKLTKIKIQALKGGLLSKVYNKGKSAVRIRMLKSHVRKWNAKESGKKPINLYSAIAGKDIINKTLANKYLKHFIPDMNKYGTKKCLRNMIYKSSVINLRILKPYFNKWRFKVIKIKEKAITYDASSRLMKNAKSHQYTIKTIRLLTDKLSHWRLKARNDNRKIDSLFSEAFKNLKLHNLIENGPIIIKGMNNQRIDNKKTKALKELPIKRAKCDKTKLKKYFDLYKNNIQKIKFNAMRDYIKRKLLKQIIKKRSNGGILKYFLNWKNHIHNKHFQTPPLIQLGLNVLRMATIRKAYEILIKRANMINVPIPRGMGFKKALVNRQINVAKSICLRNISMRSMWNKWKRKSNELKAKDTNIHFFNRIISERIKKGDSILLRKGNTKWKDNTNRIVNKSHIKQLRLKLLSQLYEKNTKLYLKRYYNKWHNKTNIKADKLNSINNAMNKLTASVNHPVVNQMKKMILNQGQQKQSKALLSHALRRKDKANLMSSFSKWKRQIIKYKEIHLKAIVLKNLTNKQCHKTDEYYNKRLNEALLIWRIKTVPRDYLHRIERVRIGNDKLKSCLRKQFEKTVLSKIHSNSHDKHFKSLLSKVIKRLCPKSNEKMMSHWMRKWLSKLGDTNKLKHQCYEFFYKYLLSNQMHIKIINEPEQDILHGMKTYHQLKNNKAQTVYSFIKGILTIKRQCNILKRNIFLNKRVVSKQSSVVTKYDILFKKWIRTCRYIKSIEDASTIQRFLKSKINNPIDKRKRIVRGGIFLEQSIKYVIMNRIKSQGKGSLMEKLLKRHIKNQDNLNSKSIRNNIIHWKEMLPLLKKENSAKVIQNNYRNFRSRCKVTNAITLNLKMKYLLLKLLRKYIDIRKSCFNKWLYETKASRCNTKATIIQKFTSKRLKALLEARAKAKVHYIIRMSYIRLLYTMMARASKITGEKGVVMYKTIEDLYIRRPFTNLLNGFKWINRILLLKVITPKVNKCLRNHYIPNALRVWNEKTWGDKLKKTIKLQKWIRKQILIYKANIRNKRQLLLGRFLMKMTRNDDMRVAIPFKIWNKKTHLDILNDKVLIVQKIYKAGKVKKKVDILLYQNRLCSLFKKDIYNKLNQCMNNANQCSKGLQATLSTISHFDSRYATNNLIAYSNESLVNKILLSILNKRQCYDSLSDIKRYFDRWRYKTSISHNAILKIQNASRHNIALKKRTNLERSKAQLYHYVIKAIDSDNNRLNSAFRRFNLKIQLDKCKEMSELIQDYLVPKLERLLDKKFKNLFYYLKSRLLSRRLNQLSKVNKLKEAVASKNKRLFLERLQSKYKCNRLKWFFIRRFHFNDDKLLLLYLEKYFNHWRIQLGGIRQHIREKAIVIQRNVRGYLSKRLVDKIRNRNSMLLVLLLNVMNDKELQSKVAFNLWRTNAKSIKLDESARVIQVYIRIILKKIDMKNQSKRSSNIIEGLNQLLNMAYYKREPFNKIKSEFNRSKFNKMNFSLMKKHKDHLQTSMNAIKSKNNSNLLNLLITKKTNGRNSILRKSLLKWNTKAYYLKRSLACRIIQFNYRIYKSNERKLQLNTSIKDLMNNLILKYSDIMRYYMNKWKKNTQKTNILRAGRKINRFIDKKYSECKVKQNYHKLYALLKMKDHNYSSLNLLNKIKQCQALLHLIKPIELNIKKYGYNKLIDTIKLMRLGKRLNVILNNLDKRKEFIALYDYNNHWRYQRMKLQQKDEELIKLINVIENRSKIIKVQTINSSFIIKRLFKTIPKIRALDFYDRLKRNKKAKMKIEAMSKCFFDINIDNKAYNTTLLITKVYKLYIYRIMSKMFNSINRCVFNRVNPLIKKEFFEKLSADAHLKSAYKYINSRKGVSQGKTNSFRFKAKMTNSKHSFLYRDNNNLMMIKKLMPYFCSYLTKKYQNRIREALNAIRIDQLSEKFCSLYKNYIQKSLINPKQELYNSMKKDSHNKDTIGPKLLRLFNLFRRGYIRHITNSIEKPKKVFKLMYMIMMTNMHKKVAKKRFIREIIRKWRFGSFVRVMTRKKLELMYKNFHTSYLQMANEVFGDDDGINPSVIKEFERFGSSIGMFTNEEPEKGNELGKDFLKKIQKKYIFEPSMITNEKDSIIPTKNIKKEEVNSYYYIEDNIDPTKKSNNKSET